MISFKRTHEAEFHNRNILNTFNGNLVEELKVLQGSSLHYGSEFQGTTGIANLIHHHEDRDKVINIIKKGSQYHMSPIKEVTSKSDLFVMILCGNHKSAQTNLNVVPLEKSMGKEKDHCWSLPLTIDSVHHINTAGGVPIRVAYQLSINKKIYCYTNRRVTHKCSFPGPSGLSVNNHALKDTLQPFFYGLCLLRILHMIAAT